MVKPLSKKYTEMRMCVTLKFCCRPLKKFIKAVCCYPERVTQEDYDAAMPGFQESEKVRDCQ